ncbi:glycosyltransferase involved in cell wall biosynthesis [Crossiella equi]|uniref:Glycosyltransferase involved in cell wall biosynthesis n=1 Tax=Crossiella equi TaxID=130796 RepID=A0ABS5AJC7_9PSEU|nr:glycosyltransferase [Crossiella equi]MBP2476677.1 glycosyltransferase involved in cell wall biosynthesis [Crossiella equi]
MNQRPLRIVIGADTFPPDVNGAANFAHRLASGLAAQGHDVHVLCPQPDASSTMLAGSHAMDGITVHHTRSYRWPFYQKFRFSLPWQAKVSARELLAELRPDVVHVQAHFVVGRALAQAAPALGIPLVATNHFMPENLFGLVKMPNVLRTAAARWAWRDLVKVFGQAQVVTAPTPRAVELLRDNHIGREALAISCGIDVDRYRALPTPAPSTGKTVLFVGRLDEEKRVDELLRALAKVPEELGVRAEVVGDGSCRTALENLAHQLGVQDRVVFHGHLSDEELLAAYARCDLFCMPGIAELQSLVTMEAMAAGKPVVAADAMALPHLVRPGHNGWLFPPGNVHVLAARLTQTLGDEEMLARMGAASAELIAGHAIANTLGRFEAIYRDLVGERAQVHALPGRAEERELSRTA